MTGYSANLEDLTLKNTNFRRVLYTGVHLQLVLMSLLPNEEIGEEMHEAVDQFFRLEAGTIKIIMSGEETILTNGMAAIVPAGVVHNVINIGKTVAKLYTIYSPPNHPDQKIQPTKAEAQES